MKTLPLTGMADYKFTMTVSALDCTGCGSCANVCPGKKGAKALAMENMEANMGQQKFFDYGVKLPVKEDVIAKYKEITVKGSQFKQPLLEFSGACAGCGETPYAKLITQLFGDRMYLSLIHILFDEKLAGLEPEIVVTCVKLDFAVVNICCVGADLIQEITVVGYHNNCIVKVEDVYKRQQCKFPLYPPAFFLSYRGRTGSNGGKQRRVRCRGRYVLIF